ncbi:hypothetical protein H4Q26_009306 [Puccinia striiformis f. sp. tritici PST-130]|nr:hypothetical protein H4Q26_009306 [Puccinia striiformis f. sp. tritici PST-130]
MGLIMTNKSRYPRSKWATSNRPLDPPHIGASADSGLIVGHTALLSTKRSREEFEAHNGRQCMEEQQKAKKQIQGVLDSGDERLGPMGDVPDHNRPRNGETKDSPIMRDFAARFDAEVEKLNNLRPSRLTTDLISLSDMPLDLHLIHDSDSIDSSQGSREFIIQLKRLRGRGKNYTKSMDRSKRRILDILEAMGLFHGLAVLHGLDPQILGNLKDLFAWFWSIFFEATEDGPPLFGLFKGTLEAAENAGKQFGSVKSEMSLVLANPKDLNPKDFFLSRLALSLIEYRYSMNASRLGKCDRNTDHTGRFRMKMEDICQSRQPGLEKSDKLSDELQKQILLYTGWNKSKLASFLQSLNDIAIKGVYDVYPDISQEIRAILTNKIKAIADPHKLLDRIMKNHKSHMERVGNVERAQPEQKEPEAPSNTCSTALSPAPSYYFNILNLLSFLHFNLALNLDW